MQGNWFDRLKYKHLIVKALDPESDFDPAMRREIVEINDILAPAFEIIEITNCEDKYVFYGDFLRAAEPLMAGTEYMKCRQWLANFELA
jgi:hypothetical protein